MVAGDLDIVLTWRNHPDVRHNMYDQHVISIEEHKHWYEQALKDSKRHLLIYEANHTLLGFINLHQGASEAIADWGFYAAIGSPKGTGRKLGHAALRYAFINLGFHKICGQVISYNEKSIKFHLRLGFLKEGVLQDQYFDGHRYHDVWCFGLLANHWLKKS